MIQYFHKVLKRIGIAHRFLLAQEFRLLAATLVLAPVPWLIDYGQDHALFADRYVLQEVHTELGLAAFTWIPDDVKPAIAERGFRVCESGEVLAMEGLRFQCFHASLGGTAHEDIRREGRGLYQYDGEGLRFSSSDGSNPVGNGRVYVISIPWGRGEGGETTTGVRAMIEMACRAPIALFAWVLARKRMWPWIRQRYRTG